MARAFHRLLRDMGHNVDVISSLRSYDREGSVTNQQQIKRHADNERDRIIACLEGLGSPIDFWLTYHAYHKAPDWFGPEICDRFAIPYMLAEASLAKKQANGPWASGHARMIEALQAANRVLALTGEDLEGLKEVIDPERITVFPPFMDVTMARSSKFRPEVRKEIAQRLALDTSKTWILTVAMMRDDVKFKSYKLMIDALRHLRGSAWHWLVIGDGERRDDIAALCEHAFPERYTMLGQMAAEEIKDYCLIADIFAWPALREAYGMALLEAQAAGLPVLAGREGGVETIVADHVSGILVTANASEFAAGLRSLLDDPALRKRLGREATIRTQKFHDVPAAKHRMLNALDAALTHQRINTPDRSSLP